jgi:cobaltochelatase CobN
MLIVVLSIGVNYDNSLDVSTNTLRNDVPDLKIIPYNASDLDRDSDLNCNFIENVKTSNMVIIKSHSDVNVYKKFDRLKKILENNEIPTLLECTQQFITESYRSMFKGNDEEYFLLSIMIKIGGCENWTSVIKWCLNKFQNLEYYIDEPYIPPAQGIYISEGKYAEITKLNEFIDKTRSNVLILFHQKQFNNRDIKWLDDLVFILRNKDVNPIPVFILTYSDPSLDSIGIKKLVDKYLIHNGKSVVDCVIETMSFSQRILSRTQSDALNSNDNFFSRLNVPVLKVLLSDQTYDQWKTDPLGLSITQMSPNLNSPELDGQIIELLCATTESTETGSKEHISVMDRMNLIADRTIAWTNLRNKPNSKKKVAILLYMYPPRMDLAGGAFGLDSMESVYDLLISMKAQGYDIGNNIPANGKALCELLLSKTTNCIEYLSDRQALETSAGSVNIKEYLKILEEIPVTSSKTLCDDWGNPPGKVMVSGKDILIPGIVLGKTFIGFQPDRGKSTAESYHDAYRSMPHQYLAFYRWLEKDYVADAVIHIGTHGTLEWLPGKAAYLSDECYPGIVLDSLPNIYPYIVDNPGEGIQAKRRSAAVIVTHMIPPMMRTVAYDHLKDIEKLLSSFRIAENNRAKNECEMIFSQINDLLLKNNLSDLLSDRSMEEQVDLIHDYILDLKDNLINDGLHVLGRIPEGKRLDEMIYSMTRVDSGSSLRSAVSKYVSNNGIEKDPEDLAEDIVHTLHSLDFSTESIKLITDSFGSEDITNACEEICTDIYPKLLSITDETVNILEALEGHYIPPSPSGCPTRGRTDMLPTGRNFYSLDPDEIPWESSWEIGIKQADQMIERHIEATGEYPGNIGIVLWDVETIRTGGEDIAYILWLMGLRPIWTKEGRVIGLDIVPKEELGRPRFDVTIRSSGLFRDTFPNLLELLDEGVHMIMDLDEEDHDNHLKANLRRRMSELVKEGIPTDQAMDRASKRIFSAAPGQYGAGVIAAIVRSGWDNVGDLANLFIDYGCFAYGKGKFGERSEKDFRRCLSEIKVTVKNHTTREMDMFDMDDEYDFLGGMNAAVKSLTGNKPVSYMGDSSDPNNIKTRTAEEEARYIFRSKLCNPEWIRGLRDFDYSGAQQLSKVLEYVFAWDATSDIIEDWMFEYMAKGFVLEKETNEWLKECNPYALKAMIERLLEADERDLWAADEQILDKLREAYLETEGIVEEKMNR